MALPFDFLDPQGAQDGRLLHFELANPGDPKHVGAYGFDASSIGTLLASPQTIFAAGVECIALSAPSIQYRADAERVIQPSGIEHGGFPAPAIGSAVRGSFDSPYTPPANYNLHFQFVPDSGSPLREVHPHAIAAPEIGAQKVAPSPYLRPFGLDATKWGASVVTNKSDLEQSVYPFGFVETVGGLPSLGRALRFNFNNPAYVPTPGWGVDFDFVLQGGTQGVFAGMGVAGQFGSPGVQSTISEVYPAGFKSEAIGAALVWYRYAVTTIGRDSQAFGYGSVQTMRAYVYPQGFNAQLFGTANPYNLRQYLLASGANTALFGAAFVKGGVKTVIPQSLAAPLVPAPLVTNTRADQTARPSGIPPGDAGKPGVSPQTVFTFGFIGVVGFPFVNRSPNPPGFDSAAFGRPVIRDKAGYLYPQGLQALEVGYPRVADKAQKLLHKASSVTAVFGDVRVQLTLAKLVPVGFDSLEAASWATVRNTRRFVLPGAIPPVAVSPALQVANKTPSIHPQGIASLAMGRAEHMVVGERVRDVLPAGIPPLFPQFGPVSLWQTPSLAPVGLNGLSVPAPNVWFGVRSVAAIGTDAKLIGRPTLDFSYRRIVTEARNGMQAFGSGRVEFTQRSIIAGAPSFDVYGTPWVSYGERVLAPAPISSILTGYPKVIRPRYLQPEGLLATRWGSRIVPESQTLYPSGPATAFGLTAVDNRKKYLRPDSIRTYPEPKQHWGTARVWNLRQFVTMVEDPDSELNPPKWPAWTAIANRNRVVGAIGALASAVPVPGIDNAARQLSPVGMPEPTLPEYYKAGMVAYRVRPLQLDGLEPPYFPGWTNIANGARLVKPAGFFASGMGMASVLNNRRFYKLQGFDSAWFGYPFIADRIRTLSFEPRYTIGAPHGAMPRVQLYTRYVDVAGKGIKHPDAGTPILESRRNLITPRWTLRDYFGSPALKNLTPELITRGRVSEEFGDTSIRLEWRELLGYGQDTALFGRTRIADRKQTVQVPGLRAWSIGDKITVVRTAPPLYYPQWIILDDTLDDGDQSDGYGIAPPENQVSQPRLLLQFAYVWEEFEQTLYGRPVVTANSLRVEPGIYELTVGEPSVSLKLRTLSVGGIRPTIEIPKPRLSPHTIYAVVEAPDQAVRNHPTQQDRHYVKSMSVFGEPKVSTPNNRVMVGAGPMGGYFGPVQVENSRQYVFGIGSRTQRFGLASIPGEQTIEDFYEPIDSMAFGYHQVSRPIQIGARYIYPLGFVGNPSLGAKVDLFHRVVKPYGFDVLGMGASVSNDIPYAWQRLRVGPLMPTIPEGIDSAQIGTQWISHWVREVRPEGSDYFVSEYDYQQFAQRMRVRNSKSNQPETRRVNTLGARHDSTGTASVRLGAHYIRPDGNTDQYRKGAF